MARRRKGGRGAQGAVMTPFGPMRMPGANRTRNFPYNWIVSSYGCDGTGIPSPTLYSSWSAALPGSLAWNVPVSIAAAVVVPAPMTSTPSIGRLRIDEVKGSVFFTGSGLSNDSYQVAVGAYIAQLNETTTIWSVRNPMTALDAQRDDYLFLKVVSFRSSTQAASTGVFPSVEIDLSQMFPGGILIGSGQALMYTFSMLSEAGLGAFMTTYFRTRIGPVA